MSKAEKRALEKYPLMSDDDKEGLEALERIVKECDCTSEYNELQEAKQAYFIEGYHQAEKDLELTWEDIADILDITDVIANDDSMEERLKTMSEEEYCKEVLKRFKAQKGEIV